MVKTATSYREVEFDIDNDIHNGTFVVTVFWQKKPDVKITSPRLPTMIKAFAWAEDQIDTAKGRV